MKWVCVGVALVAALLIVAGCGVDSGSRKGKWTENPFSTPGLPGPGGGGGGGGGAGGGGGGGGGPNPGGDPGSASADEQEVFKKVNEEREKAGVSALNWSDALANLARAHSHCMCERASTMSTQMGWDRRKEVVQENAATSAVTNIRSRLVVRLRSLALGRT